MTNIFRNLASWFTSGTEDFFTASLALFLERNEALREEFLEWLKPHIHEDLHRHHWRVEAQVRLPSKMGEACIDMVFSSPDLELWFEHKVSASLGKYGEADQLQKYLDAANRRMLGIHDGSTEFDWLKNRPPVKSPRILLFYVTRDSKSLDIKRYRSQIYSPETHFGLVWIPPDGHLRWRDFWDRAQTALDGALSGESGEFERTLSRQFLRYWRSLPGMWRHAAIEQDWMEMLPDSKKLPEGQACGFDEMWQDVRSVARERLYCHNIIPWRGYYLTLEFATTASPQINCIYVNPVPDPAKEINYDEQLGAHVLRLRIGRRDTEAWPEFRSHVLFENTWPTRLRLHKVDSGQQLLETRRYPQLDSLPRNRRTSSCNCRRFSCCCQSRCRGGSRGLLWHHSGAEIGGY